MSRVIALVSVLVTLLLSPAVADATTGGDLDLGRHPNVALIAGYDDLGFYYSCTGTLISPTVVVTAAHCVPGSAFLDPIGKLRIAVSFDDSYPLGQYQFGDYPILTRTLSGKTYAHPLSDGARPFDAIQISYDLGVIVLSKPATSLYPGLTPAPLPAAGLLADPVNKNKDFLAVGFGGGYPVHPMHVDFNDVTDFTADWKRRQATVHLQYLIDPNAIQVHGSPNSNPDSNAGAATCHGDSGGPLFYASTIVGVNSGGDCAHYSYEARLDTPIARDFLRQFVSLP
jgi:hypothetical protein